MLPDTPVELKEYEVFVLEIASYLVEDYDKLYVSSNADDRGILITLSVPESCAGRLIGKGGQTVEALKTLVKCYSLKRDLRLSLKLVVLE